MWSGGAGDAPEVASGVPGLRTVDDAVTDGVLHRFGRRAQMQLPHQAVFVIFNGLRRYMHHFRDRLDPLPFGHQLEHFALAQGQVRRRSVCGGGGKQFAGHGGRDVASAA